MPLYIDVHHETDVVSGAVGADAHHRDLGIQLKHGAKYLKCWYDPHTRKELALVAAPTPEAAAALHGELHGSTTTEIFEVAEDAVWRSRPDTAPSDLPWIPRPTLAPPNRPEWRSLRATSEG